MIAGAIIGVSFFIFLTVVVIVCNHKWEDLEGNKQKCTKCGVIRALPCAHKWKELESEQVCNGKNAIVGKVTTLCCEHCGERKTHRVYYSPRDEWLWKRSLK